ncbi:MAG: AMP-binding protein [Thaumarchaeota archaeon]|nr:AMP-binding protein [Nitrososphaerota archaeon]
MLKSETDKQLQEPNEEQWLDHKETYCDERIQPVPERFNQVSELLDNHIMSGRGKRVAIHYVNPTTWNIEQITYSRLYENVNRTGNALRDKTGLRRGDRIGLLLLDSPYFHYLFLGAMKIGAVPVPMNTFESKDTIKKMVSKGGMKGLAVSNTLLNRVDSIEKEVPSLSSVVVCREDGMQDYSKEHDEGDTYTSFKDILENSSSELEAEVTSKNEVAFWFYTSGSTGEPKGVVHAHHDIHYAAHAMYRHIVGMTEKDVVFSAAKLFFSAGLGPGLYGPLSFGASSVLYPDRISAKTCYDIISRAKPSIFLAVPTVFAKMLSLTKDSDFQSDISSLRLCLTGGEPLPPPVYEEWMKKMKVDLVECVGAAELTHIYLSNRIGNIRPGSGGEVNPGFQVKIVDEKGVAVPTGTIGEFLVRGDSSLLCYWNDQEKTRNTILEHGWIRTGDLFKVDEDGFYYFCGRYDYAFKASGMWISSSFLIILLNISVSSPSTKVAFGKEVFSA